MAYKATFSVPERPLGRKDIEFDIKKDDAMLGTLEVSQDISDIRKIEGQKRL